MTHRFNQKGRPFLILDDDGYMQLYTQDGSNVGQNLFLRVQDACDDAPFVIGKFIVNIVSTKEEMIKEIEKYKTEI